MVPQQKGAGPACECCEKTGHPSFKCYNRNQTCRACGKRGHIASGCSQGGITKYVTQDDTEASSPEHISESASDAGADEQFLFNLNAVTTRKKGIGVDEYVDGVPLHLELEKGAYVTVVSKKTWQDFFLVGNLGKASVKLRTYTGEPLDIVSQTDVNFGPLGSIVMLMVSLAFHGLERLEHKEVDFGPSACNLIYVGKLPLHAKDLQLATGFNPTLSAVLR